MGFLQLRTHTMRDGHICSPRYSQSSRIPPNNLLSKASSPFACLRVSRSLLVRLLSFSCMYHTLSLYDCQGEGIYFSVSIYRRSVGLHPSTSQRRRAAPSEMPCSPFSILHIECGRTLICRASSACVSPACNRSAVKRFFTSRFLRSFVLSEGDAVVIR